MANKKYSKKENYIQILRKYASDNPEIAGALEEVEKLKKDYNHLKKESAYKEKMGTLLRQMVPHEIKNPLNNIKGYVSLLDFQGEEMSFEQKKEWYDILDKEADKISDISNILLLSGYSKEDLEKDPKFFSLENMALSYAHTANAELIGEKIGLNVKYNRPYNKDLEVLSNEGLFKTIWGTLFGNAVNFAPENTKIKQGIRFNRENLEIIVENKHKNHNQQRKSFGMGKGLGLEFTERMVGTLKGTVKTYDKPIIPQTYDVSQYFGHKITSKTEEKDYDTFAVKILLPSLKIPTKQ